MYHKVLVEGIQEVNSSFTQVVRKSIFMILKYNNIFFLVHLVQNNQYKIIDEITLNSVLPIILKLNVS